MSNDGVWVKVWPESGDASIPAVIGGENGASVERGKTIDGTVYDIYTFTDDTRDDLSLTVDTPGMADIVVVGAGGYGAGGAGGATGGGGGAGGLLEANVYLEGLNVVKVGGAANYYGYSGNGEASLIGNYIAPGGGQGCNGTYSTSGNGGSGGGGASAATMLQGMGTPGLGHDGDKTIPTAGGGGGAAGPGSGANGGPGKDVYITGNKLTLAAGGDGNKGNVSVPAPANSGNGGQTYSPGGSGIVIVRVRV